MPKAHNSKKYLENFSKEVDDALKTAALKGSPQALMLFYKVMGKLVEKAEITEIQKDLSADEHIAIRQEAQKRINGTHTPKIEYGTPTPIEEINWDEVEAEDIKIDWYALQHPGENKLP